jgi:hypothetical protein
LVFVTGAKAARYFVEVPKNVSKKADGEFHLKAASEMYSLKHLKSYKTKQLEKFHVVDTDEKTIQTLLDMKLIVFAEKDINYQLVSQSKPISVNDTGFSLQWVYV